MRLATVAAALFGLVLAAPARADVGDYVSRPIATVTLRLDGRDVSDQRILDLVQTRVGQPLAMQAVRESIVHLFSLAQFADVRVEAERQGEGVALTYVLLAQGRVRGIEIVTHGAPGIDTGVLRQLLAARFGESPLVSRMTEMATAIEQSVKSNGYLHAAVTPREQRQVGDIRLVFDINPGARAVISDVRVQGDPGVPDLMRELDLELRQPYERDRLDASVERFVESRRRLGYYDASLAVTASETAAGDLVTLSFTASRGPRTRIVFTGDPLPANRRDDLVPIASEGSTSEDVLEDATNRIETYLRGQGYRDAIAPHTREDVGEERLLTFAVKRGPLYRVDRLDITGNTSLPLATVQARLRIRPGQPFSETVLDADIAQIEDLYRREGFAQAAALATPTTAAGESAAAEANVAIAIEIREGIRTIVNSVTFEGALDGDAAALREVVGLRLGQPYFASQLAIDRDTIQLHYANLGYPAAAVTVTPGLGSTGTLADVVFSIRPGVRLFVDHVLIVGNVRTRTATIERELRVKPGDPLGLEALSESQRRLAALGLFRRARITELGHGDETRRDVVVTVEEAPVTTIGYGGGLEVGQRIRRTEEDAATEQIELAPRAFFEIGRRNLFGKNRSVNLFTRVSLLPRIVDGQPGNADSNATERSFTEYRVIGTFREPRVTGTVADAFLTGTLEQQARSSFNFSRQAFNAEIGRRLTPQSSVSTSYQLQRTEVFDEQINPEEELLIDRAFPQVRLSSFAGTVVRDSRDDLADPLNGQFYSVSSQLAARNIGSEVGFSRTFFTAQTFHPLSRVRRTVLAASARIGVAVGFPRPVELVDANGNTVVDGNGNPILVISRDLPASERFFAGGDTTVRGFALDQLGTPETIDSNGFPIGGRGLVVLNAELRVPLRGGLGVVGFVDAGNVFASAGDIRLADLRSTVGFGLRYKSPIGPIRVDMGFKTDRHDISPGNRESLTALHISLGQAF